MSVVTCRGCGTANTEFNAFCCACNAAMSLPSDGPGVFGASRARTLLFAGEQVGRYEIERLLGAGGMGEVYAARDSKHARSVALKVLSSDLAGDSRARQRMRREARAISALRHPNIATIYDVSEHAGRPFIAMELIDGGALSGRFESGEMPFAELCRIGIQIGSALGAAHGAGIVHRDVKPANVVLTDKGQVKLVDFGLAKVAAGVDVTTLTRTGAVLGTMAYMAPEQLAGENVDHRADLWSVGVLLYQGLYGKLPFDGEGLARRIFNDPLVLGESRPDVPRRFTRLITALLEKKPDDRIASAAIIEAELGKCVGRGPLFRIGMITALALVLVALIYVQRTLIAKHAAPPLIVPAHHAERAVIPVPSAEPSEALPPSESSAAAPEPSSRPERFKVKQTKKSQETHPPLPGQPETGLPAKPF